MADPEDLFRKIARNKAANIPHFEKIENHRSLVDQLQEAIEARRLELEAAAFGELPVSDIADPFEAVRLAIREGDQEAIRAAALAAYKKGQFSAVRLAGEIDQDVARLVDHLETYGELANLNQRVFMRFALAEPDGEPV
jgi:hypothetical protein